MNCLTQAWTAHAPELRAWARHRLHATADVEDLLQDLSRNTLADRLRK